MKRSKPHRVARRPLGPLPPSTWLADTMTIVLHVPPYCLSPNGRCGHWRKKHKETVSTRAVANLITLQLLAGDVPPCPVAYSLAYYWPGMARDDDNAIASCKAYLDGICSALSIDDRSMRFRQLFHHSDRKTPRLEIILHLAASGKGDA